MRKQYKKKKRSCKLCKPWKMGLMKRWKAKDKINIKDYETKTPAMKIKII